MTDRPSNSFQLTTALPPRRVLSVVDHLLRADDCRLCGITAFASNEQTPSARIELHVPRDRQHWWSPALTVHVLGDQGRTQLRGQFGPGPSLFTLYVALSAFSLFSCLVGASFAYAQWTLGATPTGLWTLPFALLPVGCVLLATWVGESGGREQMAELRAFIEAALDHGPGERK